MGDSADNVPGVKVMTSFIHSFINPIPTMLFILVLSSLFFLSFFLSSIVKNTKGIGLKTASALLNHFGTVEAMYERLGLPSILQSLPQVDEQTAQLHAIEGNDGDLAIPSSSSSSSTSFRQSKTVVTTPTNDMETKETVNDGDRDGDGDGDLLEVSNVDTRAIDALFARINAASALTKKTNKKTSKSKKKDGILQPEEEDEGGMLLVEVSEEQRLVALALAELEISLQGVCTCHRIIFYAFVSVVFDSLFTCSDCLIIRLYRLSNLIDLYLNRCVQVHCPH